MSITFAILAVAWAIAQHSLASNGDSNRDVTAVIGCFTILAVWVFTILALVTL